MTTILIPTDFSPQTAANVAQLAANTSGKVSVILFHAFSTPPALAGAMYRAGLSNYQGLVSENLRLMCRRIRLRHPHIAHISFQMFYGHSVPDFVSFARRHNVSSIALPEGYQWHPVDVASINPLPLFRASGIAIAAA